MASLADFNTRDRAEEGTRVDLLLPNGSPSGEWVQVRSYMATVAQQARFDVERRRAEKGDKLSYDDTQRLEAESRAALVKAWSFEDPCTPENVKAWLYNSQTVANQIMVVATQDERFFGQGSPASTDGPKAS